MADNFDLLVFSHLRWDFVYQRPQHILSRLAARRRVIFLEEPVFDPSSDGHWEQYSPQPGLTVCRPHLPHQGTGFGDQQLPALRQLLAQLIDRERIEEPVAWVYTPMAMPLVEASRPRAIIYDCMDELSAFKGASPLLIDREAELLAACHLVFTGGPSLYAHKKDRHRAVHCFPSSVDVAHFARGRQGMAEAADQAGFPHPRLGYYGVIDERIDLALLAALADSRPDWHIVMVGPVVKIDETDLPRRDNIHYLGMRTYEQLPSYLAGWDVCLLPFARNEATRFISPTKILEYMAVERPIVSTPIVDVAEPYGSVVYLGDTAERFVSACRSALESSGSQRAARAEAMRRVLARTSWDATVGQMELLVEEAARRPTHAVPLVGNAENDNVTQAGGKHAAPAGSHRAGGHWPAIVIGAGPTGLSAAYHLGADALLLEQNDTIGGWCRSMEVNGFTFDYAGHIMFSNDAYVHELYDRLLGDNVHWQNREAWIYSKGVHTRYPFQGALYGLPAAVIKECLLGAIEARFGAPQAICQPAKGHAAPRNGNGSAQPADGAKHRSNGRSANGKDGSLHDCCADGIMESTAALGLTGVAGEPRNFEEFIYKVWGTGIAKHFAIPYNRKLWAVPLSEMETSWLGGRVPLPDLEEMIAGALEPVAKPMGPNARFGYPLRGGFQSLMDGFRPYLDDQLWLNARVVEISPATRRVTLADRTSLSYEYLVNTMPLPVLVRMLGDEAPDEVRRAASRLRFVSVRCVHLGIGREHLTDKHWIYYPEDSVFHRIFVQGNASPHCNPAGGFGLTCEITYSPHKPLPCDGQDLIDLCIRDCRRVGLIDEQDPVWAAAQCDLPHAYVVYDHARRENVALIRNWLEAHDILLAGRYSEWEYYNSDHAFLAGKRAAETVRQLQGSAITTGSALT